MLASEREMGEKVCAVFTAAFHHDAIRHCIGSQCAHWRWAGWRTKDAHIVSPNPMPQQRDGDQLGFCGLAGKPYESP